MIKVNVVVAASALLLAASWLSFAASKPAAWHGSNLAPVPSAFVEPGDGDTPADAAGDPDIYPLLGP